MNAVHWASADAHRTWLRLVLDNDVASAKLPTVSECLLREIFTVEPRWLREHLPAAGMIALAHLALHARLDALGTITWADSYSAHVVPAISAAHAQLDRLEATADRLDEAQGAAMAVAARERLLLWAKETAKCHTRQGLSDRRGSMES